MIILMYFMEERRGFFMARIDSAYQYYLTTYGNKFTGSRYDTHKKSELRSVYNNILKTNKESPLYKINRSSDITRFAIDVKEHARSMQHVIASISTEGDDIATLMNKRVAHSSLEEYVDVSYVGSGHEEKKEPFSISVDKLASPQINRGNFLNPTGHSFEEGTFSFDLDTITNSFEFQLNVTSQDTNIQVQEKIARLVNQSNVGLIAEIEHNEKGESALTLTSKQTGLSQGEDFLFKIQSGSSWNELNTLGIHKVAEAASNSSFVLNGVEHSSLSNTFTINKAFEITLKAPTPMDTTATIGFKANTEAVADGVKQLLNAYNGMLQISENYSSSHQNKQLFQEINSIGLRFADTLAPYGVLRDEKGYLTLDEDKLGPQITDQTSSQKAFQSLNQLKQSLSRQANKMALNPMHYVDKIMVEYKNPGKTFATPYIPSAYTGLLIDQHL